MEIKQLERIFEEVGPLEDDILGCVQVAENEYAIQFVDVDVFAEWDATSGRLLMSAEIGTPPAARTERIYETLLVYSNLSRQTGGLRMALTGREGTAVQLVDLAGAEIEPRRIAIVAANLAERTRIWQAYFESETESETDEGTVDMPPPLLPLDIIHA